MRRKLAYSANQLGINLLWQAFNTVAVFYYVTDLHVNGTQLSLGLIVYGIVNAFLNLLAGYVSDRTTSRFGRRIPYVVLGSLPLGLAFYFLFRPPLVSGGMLIVYFLIMTFLFDFFFTFVALNIGALYPEMYRTARDRSYVSAWQQLFGILGLIAGVALSKSVGQALGWSTMAAVFAVISVISLYLSLAGSFEDPSYRDEPLAFKQALGETIKNRRFLFYVFANLFIQLATTMMVTLSSFYTKYVVVLTPLQSTLFLGMIFVVAIPLSFVWARLAIRLSAIRATLISCLIYILVMLTFLILHTAIATIIVGAVMGVPVAGFMVLLNVLLADVIDHDEKVTGKRREGMYLGINGLIVRLGMSIQYAIMAIFFSISGYNANRVTQQIGTVHGFRILMGGLSAFVVLIALVLLAGYGRYARRNA
ncbi:MAG: MFS transporter [Firmicutes bacterium]|nr:MFS transporter [Bacillota bacterium]